MYLAILAFLTSIAYLPGITSAAYAPRWWVLVIGAPLVLIKTRPVTLTTGHWLGLVFLGVVAESLCWSVSRVDTLNGLVQLTALAMVFCVASETEDLEPFWLALGFGAAINTAVAVVQTVTSAFVESKGIAGLFYQQDFFGSFCAVTLVGLVYGTTHHRKLAWGLATAALCGLLLSASRGALLAAGVGFVAMWVLALPTVRKRVWAGAAVALVVAAAMVGFYHFMPTRQEALNMRFLEWDWVVQNLHWWGWGYNTLGSVLTFEHAENEYLELAFDLGVLSATFWLLVAYAVKGYKHAPASAAALATLLANSFTAFPLRNPATAMVAAVVLGGLCGVRGRVRSTGRQSGAVRKANSWPQRDRGRPSDLSGATDRIPFGSPHSFHR